MHVDYDDILRVWQEADDIPEIQDASRRTTRCPTSRSAPRCFEGIGRDPAGIVRSVQTVISYEDVAS